MKIIILLILSLLLQVNIHAQEVGSFYFDGSDDYMESKASLNAWFQGDKTEMTMTCWVYLVEVEHKKYWATTGYGSEWALGFSTSRWVSSFLSDTSRNYLEGYTVVGLNEWHHIAMTWNGAIRRVYLDGELENSCVDTGTIDGHGVDTVCRLGGKWGAVYSSLRLDEMRFYSKWLSPAEISNLASRIGVEEQDGLEAYWCLDEIGGRPMDKSGNGCHIDEITGTLTKENAQFKRIIGE